MDFLERLDERCGKLLEETEGLRRRLVKCEEALKYYWNGPDGKRAHEYFKEWVGPRRVWVVFPKPRYYGGKDTCFSTRTYHGPPEYDPLTEVAIEFIEAKQTKGEK